jgi:hypothetical protein
MAMDIKITIRGGRDEGGVRAFKPGDLVQGSIQITPDQDAKCKHLYVRLRWHTEGRGDRDDGVAAEGDLYQGDLKSGVPFYQRFHLKLPESPWSYAGMLVNIVWEVEVTLDLPWAKDPKEILPIIMAPD